MISTSFKFIVLSVLSKYMLAPLSSRFFEDVFEHRIRELISMEKIEFEVERENLLARQLQLLYRMF